MGSTDETSDDERRKQEDALEGDALGLLRKLDKARGTSIDELADRLRARRVVLDALGRRRKKWLKLDGRAWVIVIALAFTGFALVLHLKHVRSEDANLHLTVHAIAFRLPKSLDARSTTVVIAPNVPVSALDLDRVDFASNLSISIDPANSTSLQGRVIRDEGADRTRSKLAILNAIKFPRGCVLRLEAEGHQIRWTVEPDPDVLSGSDEFAVVDVSVPPDWAWTPLPTDPETSSEPAASLTRVKLRTDLSRGPVTFRTQMSPEFVDRIRPLGLQGESIEELDTLRHLEGSSPSFVSEIIGGRIDFPGVEDGSVSLQYREWLRTDEMDGCITRLALTSEVQPKSDDSVAIDGVAFELLWRGEVRGLRAGHPDRMRILMPTCLQSWLGSRWRVFIAGVLVYAALYIIALLLGRSPEVTDIMEIPKVS